MVKTGDKIKVRVIGVDKARNRISLSARTKPREDRAREGRAPSRPGGYTSGPRGGGNRPRPSSGFVCNPFANL